jgi:hypothetical protein
MVLRPESSLTKQVMRHIHGLLQLPAFPYDNFGKENHREFLERRKREADREEQVSVSFWN